MSILRIPSQGLSPRGINEYAADQGQQVVLGAQSVPKEGRLLSIQPDVWIPIVESAVDYGTVCHSPETQRAL